MVVERPVTRRARSRLEHWDSQFHLRIFAATRNQLPVSIYDILQLIRNRNAWIELKRKAFSQDRRRDYCAHHAQVIGALENRDAEGAAQAMRLHIEAIETTLFGRALRRFLRPPLQRGADEERAPTSSAGAKQPLFCSRPLV
jgi:DNA-binding FadR family transcriptional regulator